jgi:hypothetical protein
MGFLSVEFTLRIGCINNCLKYCPQDVFLKAYPKDSPKILTLQSFKRMLSTVPASVDVDFSGWTEPFTNKECIDMMEFANRQGHRLALYTTLVGATEKDVLRASKLNYRVVVIHHPDNEVFKVSQDQEHKLIQLSDLLHCLVPYAQDMSFKPPWFVTNGRENFCRGIITRDLPITYCPKHGFPQFEVLPDGEVYLCCMDFGLWHRIGNLLTESYMTLYDRYEKMPKDFKICHYCTYNCYSGPKALANNDFRHPSMIRKYKPSTGNVIYQR